MRTVKNARAPALHGPGLFNGSARGMGGSGRASDSIADPFEGEIKYRRAMRFSGFAR